MTTKYNNADIERAICMAVYNGESMKVYDIKYPKMIQQNCLDSINGFIYGSIFEIILTMLIGRLLSSPWWQRSLRSIFLAVEIFYLFFR